MFKVGDKVRILLDLSFLYPSFLRVYQEVGYATICYANDNYVNVEVKNKDGEIYFDGFTNRHVAHFNVDSNLSLHERIQIFLEREKYFR